MHRNRARLSSAVGANWGGRVRQRVQVAVFVFPYERVFRLGAGAVARWVDFRHVRPWAAR